MGITLTNTFVDGTTMVASQVLQNFTDIEAWLNDGVANLDIGASALERRHLYKPDPFGFPSNGVRGQWHDLYGHDHGRYDGPAIQLAQHVSYLFPDTRFDNDVTPIPGAMWCGYLSSGSRVRATSNLWTAEIHNHASTDWPKEAGDIRLYYNRVGDPNTYVNLTAAWREVLTEAQSAGWQGSFGNHNRAVSIHGSFTAAQSDVYNVFASYRMADADAVANQRIFWSRGIRVAVRHL